MKLEQRLDRIRFSTEQLNFIPFDLFIHIVTWNRLSTSGTWTVLGRADVRASSRLSTILMAMFLRLLLELVGFITCLRASLKCDKTSSMDV